jgi:hypothetical protein
MNLNLIESNGKLMQNYSSKLMKYKNMGDPQHNYALFKAQEEGCFLDMAYITSFLMLGLVGAKEIIKDLKPHYKGGDIKIIYQFLA